MKRLLQDLYNPQLVWLLIFVGLIALGIFLPEISGK